MYIRRSCNPTAEALWPRCPSSHPKYTKGPSPEGRKERIWPEALKRHLGKGDSGEIIQGFRALQKVSGDELRVMLSQLGELHQSQNKHFGVQVLSPALAHGRHGVKV